MTISKGTRLEVYKRDNFVCKECKSNQNLTLDHIIPKINGGDDSINNLQTLCQTCNSKKGNNYDRKWYEKFFMNIAFMKDLRSLEKRIVAFVESKIERNKQSTNSLIGMQNSEISKIKESLGAYMSPHEAIQMRIKLVGIENNIKRIEKESLERDKYLKKCIVLIIEELQSK